MTTTVGVVLLLLGCSCFHLVAPDSQGDALFDLRNTLKAAPDQLSDWNQDEDNPCAWSKVNCDANHNVISVSMPFMGFTGSLSPRIRVLSKLVILSLQGNEITGGIPEDYGNLSSLKVLDLESNHLSGKIPSSLGNLQNVHSLMLSENNFEGPIPESLSSLPNLNIILLGYNNLTGPIPDPLFQVSRFNFTGNRLNCGLTKTHPCTSGRGDAKKLNARLIIGVVVGVVVVLLLIGCIILFIWRGRHKGNEHEVFAGGEVDRRIAFGQLKRFTWRELQHATDKFNERNKLGQGGFGKVYKGVLKDKTKVAVKRLIDMESPVGNAAFEREVEMISVAAHRNLIRLIGVCTTPTERLLVYPYMQNLSVAYRLREVKPGEAILDWATRKSIALGAARGLEYLHEHCNPRIIHRDVKAENVFLDENLEAVLGDFGFAKLVDEGKTHVTTSNVYGTRGHIDPEYYSTLKSSERTDIYAYGVMLLEIVTGQRPVDHSQEDCPSLLERVKKAESEQRLDDIVDRNLNRNYNMHEVEMMIKVALLCTQGSEDRPAMSEVLRMLEGEGFAERWEKWQKVEVTRRQDSDWFQREFARIGNKEESTSRMTMSVITEVSGEASDNGAGFKNPDGTPQNTETRNECRVSLDQELHGVAA